MNEQQLFDTYVIALDAYAQEHPRPMDQGADVFMDWCEGRTKAALCAVVKADRGELVPA